MNYKNLNFIPFILLFVGINFVYAQSDCGIYRLENAVSGATNTVDVYYENPVDGNDAQILIDFIDIEFRVEFSNVQTIIEVANTNNSIPSGVPIQVEQVGASTNVIRITDNVSGNFNINDGKLCTIEFDLPPGECTDIEITSLGYFINTTGGTGACTSSNTSISNINNFCSGNQVSGSVSLVSGSNPGVPNTSINFENDVENIDINTMSDNSGTYSIDVPNTTYDVLATKSDDNVCGVTTFDLVLIQKHILNLELLPAPWQRVAANAAIGDLMSTSIGGSGQTITSQDLVKIRGEILEHSSTNMDQLWAFLTPQAFLGLSNPSNPAEVPQFSENATLNVQNDVQLYDFFAIKVGDVNGSCQVPMGENVESITTERNVTITSTGGAIGQEIQIPVYINSFINQSAFSLGIHFLNDVLEVTDILNGSLTVSSPKGNAFEIHTDKRGFDMVWYDMNLNGVSSSFTPLFYIKATVLQPFVSLTGLVETDSSKVLNVIFPANNPNRSVERLVISNSLGGSLAEENPNSPIANQNHNLVSPNPFKHELKWQLNVKKHENALIKITDINGKTWLNIKRTLEQGYNEVYLSNLNHLPKGYLNYQIILSNEVISGKILKLE